MNDDTHIIHPMYHINLWLNYSGPRTLCGIPFGEIAELDWYDKPTCEACILLKFYNELKCKT
jgi:hypothetical protein